MEYKVSNVLEVQTPTDNGLDIYIDHGKDEIAVIKLRSKNIEHFNKLGAGLETVIKSYLKKLNGK